MSQNVSIFTTNVSSVIFVSDFLNEDLIMTREQMIRYLLFHQMLNNPLPWRVERDWAYEVTASNGHIVAKCQRYEEAVEIIETAEKLNKEIDVIIIKIK